MSLLNSILDFNLPIFLLFGSLVFFSFNCTYTLWGSTKDISPLSSYNNDDVIQQRILVIYKKFLSDKAEHTSYIVLTILALVLLFSAPTAQSLILSTQSESFLTSYSTL
jgi:hypothetical protein